MSCGNKAAELTAVACLSMRIFSRLKMYFLLA